MTTVTKPIVSDKGLPIISRFIGLSLHLIDFVKSFIKSLLIEDIHDQLHIYLVKCYTISCNKPIDSSSTRLVLVLLYTSTEVCHETSLMFP